MHKIVFFKLSDKFCKCVAYVVHVLYLMKLNIRTYSLHSVQINSLLRFCSYCTFSTGQVQIQRVFTKDKKLYCNTQSYEFHGVET